MGNPVSKILRVIGGLEIAVGVLVGLILGNSGYETNWIIVVLWTFIGFTSGILFIGFSEIIELLNKINKKLGNESHENESQIGILSNKEALDQLDSKIINNGE